jgi:recombination protein RecA
MAKEKKAGLDMAAMDIDEVIESLNKKYGDNTIIRASEAKGAEIKFIATGPYALDFALGGGFPENRIIELYGPFSSFKSTISLYTSRNFLRKYSSGVVIYIDLEKSFDPKYAKQLGIDLQRVLLVNADSGEQAVNVLEKLMQLSVPTFVVLDSVAALIPAAEIMSEAEQQHMGLQARLVNKMMRIATARLKRNMYDDSAPSMTVLCLNQLREKIGVMFGNPETTPGGKGKDFFYSTIVRVSSTKSNIIAKDEERNGEKHSVKYGQVVTFMVRKNKCGGPQHEEGEFRYHYRDYEDNKAYTFNNIDALFHYGAFHDVIQIVQGRYTYRNISEKMEKRFKEALKKNPSVQLNLYHEILNAMRPQLPKALSPKKGLLKSKPQEDEDDAIEDGE